MQIDQEIHILIKWQPKQLELWRLVDESPQTWIGYGGARGGAKSHAARMIMIARRLKYEGTNGLLFRKTYNDLYENHILPLFAQYPFMRDWFNKSEKILYLPNGSWIRFGYAEHHDDIYDYFGKAYADVFVDEATDLEQDQIEFLKSCNRCTDNLSITPKTLLTMNPGRIGHAFIKRIFIDKSHEGNERAEDYVFLQAYGWDNVEWSRKSLIDANVSVSDYYNKWSNDKRFKWFVEKTEYGQVLNAMPDSDRKAHLYGDWDVFAGQFFSMWRRDIHVIPSMTPAQGWPVIAGLDYGQRTALEVMTRDYDGAIVCFAECYTEHQTPSERANTIADMLLEKQIHKLLIIYDTNMDINLKEYTGYDKSPAQIFRDVFQQRMGDKAPRMRVVSKHSTDKRGYRAACNEAVKEYLQWSKPNGSLTRKSKLFVTVDCPKLITTLPGLVHDPDSPDGLDFDGKIGIDDPYDALKTGFMDLRTPARPKTQQTWEQALYTRAKKRQNQWAPGAG